jgi:outer membrane lipopolysaccharide assembly protein LptE/RlpB
MGRASRLRLAALLALVSLGSGCGYSLAGRGAFLPEYIRNIGVPAFTNNTPVFDIDRRVTEQVRRELTGRGKYKVFPAEAGNDAVLTGEISAISIVPVTFNQQQQASRYAMILSARVEFKDLKTGKVLWSNPALQFREEFEPSTGTNIGDANAFFGQDTNAMDRVAAEFSRSVVSALLEAF